MVCLSFNTVTIWPCLRHVRKSFRPSTQHNLSRLPSSETVLSRHSQRNGISEELDAAVGHFFFYFSMVRRPQLCFTYPRRHECRTVQRRNWQGHSWRCQGKSWTACRSVRGFFQEQQCVTRELLAAWSHYILLNASQRVLFLVAFLKS